MVTLSTTPPVDSLVICLDEMGPDSAKSFPGSRLVCRAPRQKRRLRAKQEIDYGRRGRGYVFGAFVPATGRAFTALYAGRSTTTFVDFLEQVEMWLDPTIGRVYAVLDNLAAHRAPDVLLWALGHPRWEFVFPPRYAASLNLIEPWWKILRSLALKGRRFATWQEVCQAVEAATGYGNAHRHPFVWGQRQRRHPARPPGTALLPLPA
jgi:transposase